MVRVRKDGKKCEVDGCTRDLHALGCCWMHYRRLRANGDPNLTKPKGGPVLLPEEIRAVGERRIKYLLDGGHIVLARDPKTGRRVWTKTAIKTVVLIEKLTDAGLPLAVAVPVAQSAATTGRKTHDLAPGISLRVEA